MKIMHERAARIGAQVDVESSPAQGTTVTLTLPVHPVSGSGVGLAGLNLEFLTESKTFTAQ
jgi:two-component system nitrate/nitrite sensor histidine kinase NarX